MADIDHDAIRWRYDQTASRHIVARAAEVEPTLLALAQSVEDVPALLAEVERLEAKVQRMAREQLTPVLENEMLVTDRAAAQKEAERLRRRHDPRCISLTDTAPFNASCDCLTFLAIERNRWETAEAQVKAVRELVREGRNVSPDYRGSEYDQGWQEGRDALDREILAALDTRSAP